MRALTPFLTAILATIPSLLSFSQDISLVTIHYPTGLRAKNVFVDYIDAENVFHKKLDSADVSFKKNRTWRYADVIIYYPDTTQSSIFLYNTFWVGNQPADIYILPDSNEKNHFQRYRLKNAVNLADSGMGKLDLSEKPIYDSIGAAIERYQKNPSNNMKAGIDSLYSRIYTKELAFFRNIKQSYFQLWFFRTRLANNHLLPVDTILHAFHSCFPDSIQKGPEGQYVAALIEQRLHAKMGRTAPDYDLHATNGRVITNENTRGKYVLFDFWASWCGPCVERMPEIRNLRSQYDTSNLLIVSITLDSNEKDFRTAAARLHMTWPLVFGDHCIIKAYDVGPIPALFLMDPQGKIVYTGTEAGEHGLISNDDNQLSKLKKILAESIGQH